MAKKEWASYEEASAFAKKEGITTAAQWRARARKGLPENIPSAPEQAYKQEFKSGGFGRFLGTGNIAPQNRQYVNYEEAAAFAQKEGITTLAQWKARSKKGLPENIPYQPWRTYKEEFKNGGMGRFLGTGIVSPQNRQYVSYEEASAFAQKEGITTYAQWQVLAKQGLPANIPAAPWNIYKEEFKNGGMGRFLATGTIATQKRQYVSYEEASDFAQKEGITSQSQWRALAKKGLPANIPADPQKVYKEEFKNGGMGRFLATGTIAPQNRQYVSYEESAEFAQMEGITTYAHWNNRVKKGLPANIPGAPWNIYKEEFKNGGMGRFLGLKNHPHESKIERSLRYSLEQAFEENAEFLSNPKVQGVSKNWRVDSLLLKERLIVEYDGSRYHHGQERKDTLKTQDLLEAGYHVVRIRGVNSRHALKALREDWDLVLDERQTHVEQISLIFQHLISLASLRLLPLSPETVSRLEEWKNQELPTVNFRTVLEGYDGFVSYEEASAFAQKEGITTYAQWQALAKQGLPKNIPYNPSQVYKEEFKKGGWGQFLGTGTIAHQNRQFATYEEASAFAKKEGITTVAQWRARAIKGLPENIPSNPWTVYKAEFEKGGIGRFLGTGTIATKNRQYLSFEKASAFAQKEGIITQRQWEARAKLGFPESIPSNPQWVYKEEFKNGGWRRFLATGPFANQPAPETPSPAPQIIPEMPSLSQWRAQRKPAPAKSQPIQQSPSAPKKQKP